MIRRLRSIATHHAERNAHAQRGSRFVERFEERSHISRLHPQRLVRLLLGLGLFSFGMANIFIPGPGGSVFILASALVLSGEVKWFAKLLDAGEVRFARPIDWVLAHPVVAVIVISATVFATMTFVTTQIL